MQGGYLSRESGKQSSESMVRLEYWGAQYYPCANGSLLLVGGACLYLEIFFLINLFIFIYLLFLAVLGLHCGVQASHCSGFSCCGARALGVWAQ